MPHPLAVGAFFGFTALLGLAWGAARALEPLRDAAGAPAGAAGRDLIPNEVLLHQLFPSFRAAATQAGPAGGLGGPLPAGPAVAAAATAYGLLGLAWIAMAATEAPRSWEASWHNRLLASGQAHARQHAAEAAAAAAEAEASWRPARPPARRISPGHLDALRPERIPDYKDSLPSLVAIAAFAGFTTLLGLAWGVAALTEAPRSWAVGWTRKLHATPRLLRST
ncbi:hypothetical protein ABPG75_004844 [Micractinium tetrahymenae]